jgi:CBS domain-containing protein/RimJ/RimL family protein N-acetyltransferase
MKTAPLTDIRSSTIFSTPNVFLDKRGVPVMVRAYEPHFLSDLTAMYLAFSPRGSIGGVPPVDDSECIAWVRRITAGTVSLIAMSFDGPVIGHAVLFPIRKRMCELLIVVAPPFQKSGIGTQMMRCIIQLGYEIGYIKIWLSVHRTNFIALHLYNKCGFECLAFTDSPQVEMTLDLKRYHPTANVRVAVAMNRIVITVRAGDSCRQAVQLFLDNAVDVLPVVSDANKLLGIISQTDLIFKSNLHRRVCEVATMEVVSLHENCTLDKAIRLLQTRKLRSLPVVDARHRVVGIIGRRDILAHYFKIYLEKGKSLA